jgi:hypothetical protein
MARKYARGQVTICIDIVNRPIEVPEELEKTLAYALDRVVLVGRTVVQLFRRSAPSNFLSV